MHPVIRIVTFLLVTASLATGHTQFLALNLALLIPALWLIDGWHAKSIVTQLSRLRWLFLAIIISYGWFTPGQPVWDGQAAWIPTIEGIEYGAIRVCALMLIVVAVNLLISTTPTVKLIAALYWLAVPLSWLGLPRQAIAVRIALILEILPTMHTLMDARKEQWRETKPGWRRAGPILAETFHEVQKRAETSELPVLDIAQVNSPTLKEWLLPVLLLAACTAVL